MVRLVCQVLFSPQQVLFLPCPSDQQRFYLNGTSVVDPLHLKYLRFSGRIIGLALMHRVQVGITLDRTVFLHLAGRSITLEDISVADPITYASCKRILEMDAAVVDGLELTFSRDVHVLGSRSTIELCSGGKDVHAVESMSMEQQRQLLFFWTSVKYLPSDGFGGLASKLYIYKTSESAAHLPSSHTCFYRLCLPPYPSLKVMKNQLQKIAQEHVSYSFGTW
ncbi:hypothetical protein GUJ93_ZPchr0009g957 [Zizania palustris]|uniref:HECT domain-containing protein n=1 Tax=Zizania palustris TaxID=103762 RepID=A0A8J5RA17_ZIZPA|nr:hypothetical protein GUJ93_ZPchr0009g957 [Zizania palustris]